jgi:hypothetical protein
MKERETSLTFAERSVVEKTRQHGALLKKYEGLAQQLGQRDKEISEHAKHCRQVCCFFASLLFISSDLLFSLQR